MVDIKFTETMEEGDDSIVITVPASNNIIEITTEHNDEDSSTAQFTIAAAQKLEAMLARAVRRAQANEE